MKTKFDYCDPSEEYQGYTNAQTWCVCLTIDNDKVFLREFKKTAQQLKDKKYTDAYRKAALLSKARIIYRHIKNMSPWCFDQGQTLNDVDWIEVYHQLLVE